MLFKERRAITASMNEQKMNNEFLEQKYHLDKRNVQVWMSPPYSAAVGKSKH
jgi:hypothetical protein